jgi:hypothetical protein
MLCSYGIYGQLPVLFLVYICLSETLMMFLLHSLNFLNTPKGQGDLPHTYMVYHAESIDLVP